MVPSHTEDEGRLSSERRARRGIQVFLGHLSSGVDPYPKLELLTFAGVEWDVMV